MTRENLASMAMTNRMQTTWDSPVGVLRVSICRADPDRPSCVGVYFAEHHPSPRHWCDAQTLSDWRDDPSTENVIMQLRRYFSKDGGEFDVVCGFSGTAFQRQVWLELSKIPFGQTRCYREIAAATGRPDAVRAVASAIARNPISIIVPCHRVISSGGKLTGFAGGLDRKRFLLKHEAIVSAA